MFSFKSPKNDSLICRFLIPLDFRSGFPNHHGPCRYTRSLDRIGKVAVETVLGVSTERFGHPSEIKKKWWHIFGGEENPVYMDLWWFETSKSQRFYHDYIAGKNLSSQKQPTVSSVWESLVTTGDSYMDLLQSPSPQSHVWGWRARMPYHISQEKLLRHANWFPSASVRKWIPLTSGIHFMAPAPVWVQQSSLTDVRERLMALHWGPISTCTL